MPQFEVNINGKNYAIACDEGQEEHIERLAGYVKVRVEELVESVGQIGDARLLLMASLLVSDELSDAYAELAAGQSDEKGGDSESSAEKLERLAQQAETIAARLEAS
ncbi:MAG: cell division protein ZapA [Alphaproteobacteria bacterium]|nr:cell division protein ZapA [Alphaproteobacteria bacterium]